MYHLVPAGLVAIVYTAFRMYATRDRKLTRTLLMEAVGFAVCSYIVMWFYRHFYLERMTNMGSPCPNGHQEVPDPANPTQNTCVPTGHQTYPPLNIDALKK